MAYDEDLAERVRRHCADEPVTEKAMFGGLAFLLNGNMAVAVSGQGGLLIRVGDEATDDALAQPHAELMVMRGRPMTGWIRVSAEGAETEEELADWVRRGLEFARALPAK